MMREIPVQDLTLNPMTKIADEWMLITAGSRETGYNTMTASWGQLGSLWGRLTSLIFIRPQRYTKEFVDREERYTLSFFPLEYKEKLAYLGSHSGRDEDKVAKMELTPAFGDGCTWFEEANLVLVCRKLYRAPIVPEGFVYPAIIEEHYPRRDFHDLYVGEILKVLVED